MDPTALAAAFVTSGMPAEGLLLLGPLPKTPIERGVTLSRLRALPYTIAMEEAGPDLLDTLAALEGSLGNRRAALLRENTIVRDRLAALRAMFTKPPEGRAVLVVAPSDDDDPEPLRLEDLLQEKLRAYVESLQGLAPENMYGLIMPQLERPLIRVAMEIANGRQIQAAEMLGIHRNTLRTKLRELGLDAKSAPKDEP